MTTSRAGRQSRPGSSRAPSVAHEIMKRRGKPYKTEQAKVLTRRKKLKLYNSYTTAPEGYTFVAVGTPELSARCKELSRQREIPVSVVSAREGNKHPSKVSAHVHRIGYHFKSEIVEQVCEELGYQISHGTFIKTTELHARMEAELQQSYVAKIMARHGLQPTQAPAQAPRETDVKVRAVIKELFPKVPAEDLDEIATHAWEKGTDRVGTNPYLSIFRQVQLATVARIRHVYTDYDRLLRAFGWSGARAMVEPETLRKLIEWRGENDEDDKEGNQLEEIVLETIVIDDDDDDRAAHAYGSEADDEDSDVNDTSDASIEVTHQITAHDDIGAESLDETGRHFLQRLQPRPLRTEQQNHIARQKIEAARESLRFGPPPPPADFVPVNVHFDERGLLPNSVVHDGVVYHRAPLAHDQPPPNQASIPPQQYGMYGGQYQTQALPTITQPYDTLAHRPVDNRSRDNVMPSIEPHVPVAMRELPYSPHFGAAPKTPDHQHADKRRRVEYSPSQPLSVALRPGADKYRPVSQHRPATGQPRLEFPYEPPVIDLTSPDRNNRSSNPSPMRDVLAEPSRQPELNARAQYYEPHKDPSSHAHPALGSALPRKGKLYENHVHRRQTAADLEPYDPRQPLVHFPDRKPHQEPYGAPAAHSPPHPSGVSHGTTPHSQLLYFTRDQPQTYAPPPPQQHSIYHEPENRYMIAQPVHGEPAPFQQLPYDVRSVQPPAALQRYHQPQQHIPSPAPPPPPPPMNGAPHPAQYYQPR